MSATAHTARMIAKLLAQRQTNTNEIPDLIDTVHRTIAGLGKPRATAKTTAEPAIAPKRRGRKPRLAQAPAVEAPKTEIRAEQATPAPAPVAAAAAPVLLRRAEVKKEPVEVAPILAPPALDNVTRGVVRWFDPQTRRGALRLQGVSGDVTVEAPLLAQCNITRLFKGQEVEAKLAGRPEAPQLVEFHLLTAGPAAHVNTGMVRARQQKPVMVELKREALKRVSARDAAEALLPDRRRG